MSRFGASPMALTLEHFSHGVATVRSLGREPEESFRTFQESPGGTT